MDKYKAVCAEPYKHLDDIKAMLKKMPDAPIEVCRFKNKFTNKMMSRKVYPSELINRINTLTGTSLRDESVKLTKAGKVVPKAFLRTMEGLTNGTAGGKLAILLQAYSVSDAILRAVNAPKGEKFATFAEALTFDLSYYLLMPLGMNLMYHGAGVKYTGMDKAAVERYRKGVKLLNEKVASGNCSKEQYIRVKKLLKKQLNGNSNIIDKPIKGVGRFLSTGLESIAPYTNDATSAGMKKFKNGMAKFKGISGGVMRCGLYMFAIAPLLANTATKVSHILFGKPTESVVDDVADTVPEQAVQIVTSFTDENTEAAMRILNNVSGTIKGFAGSDMRFNWDKQLKKVANNVSHEQVMNTIKPQKPNTAFDEDKKPSQKPKRLSTPTVQTLSDEKITYIPSTRAVKAPPEDLTKAKLALKSSLEAEKLTNKRFDNRFKREI
ncbi:hypothetical protein IJV79_03650, partial [bacterium]|nr:hypothetical protein [bacterium]